MRKSKRAKSNENDNQHRERWLLSYADLVTLLLALFIVMYAASNKEQARQIAESFSAQNTGGSGILPGSEAPVEQTDKFEQKLLSNPVLVGKTKIRRTAQGLTISLSEAGFFAPGDASVTAELDAVINTLAADLKENSYQIRVEGHTDSTPISNSRYPSNWELSTARASSVLIRLTDHGISPERLSAAGYGGFQPVADNATAEGRSQNRRVDVVVINR